ncbi:hypothetical protein LCGC14_0951890 [marine sediment metagenome]|uniref:Uncharacterized protein n=1 Tax=marine sediment metagenome TaxID=412755 RepID=A0A0F9NH47_9ZZZZ
MSMKFREFYNVLNKKLNTYHSKYIRMNYITPRALFDNIEERSKFMELLHELTESKLYIKCSKKFDIKTIFFDYILPIAVFLHYMHVDIEKLTQIDLYIVSQQTYNQYNPYVAGEYIDGVNPSKKHKVHIILVKQYNTVKGQGEYNEENKDKTLCSLFHELTHLIDNSDFNGLNHDISYRLQSHEIKAKAISNVFLNFYKDLIVSYDRTSQLNNSLWVVNRNLRIITKEIMHEINYNYYCIETKLHDRYFFNENVDNTKTLYENIQLLTSMRQINTLKNFVKELKERI